MFNRLLLRLRPVLVVLLLMTSASGKAEPGDLARTPYLDIDHPALKATTARVTAGATTVRKQAVRIHDFVRDEIQFGWAPAFYRQKASEVLAGEIGYCNTKSTLFVAMLRTAGIPARQHFVSLRADILHGLISPGTRYVDHSYSEVQIDGRWLRVDSYIVDRGLAIQARARLAREGRALGYGAHRNGVSDWDGRGDAFSQFVNDGTVENLTDADHGVYADVGAFYDSGRGINRLAWPLHLGFGWFARAANARVQGLRVSPD